MKLKQMVDIDISVADLAAQLSNSGDQAIFLNWLAIEFEKFSDGDRDGMQMLYIKDDLTETTKQFIAKLNEYVNGE